MDHVRIWLARLLAPLVFIAASIALVVVVQRAVDDGSSSSSSNPSITDSSVPATTEPAATGSSEEPATRRFYRVRAGDTLEEIAVRFDTSVSRLLELNPDVDPLGLSPGQRVRVA
jgi:LysM repeat protein